MRDFPSCFGESGVEIADSSTNSGKNGHNMVTCVYRTSLRGKSCLITITWSRSLMGQGFGIAVDDCSNNSLCKVDIKPWLLSKRKGLKSLEADGGKLDIFWDLSRAKFGTSPEPMEGFYVAVVFDLEMVLLIGDSSKEACRKTNVEGPPSDAILVSRREHLFGKRNYLTRSQFCDNGQIHDIAIDCEMNGGKDPCLEIRIDKKRVMQVKHLKWKFRGNQTILVDGLSVEVCWDVHSWLFGSSVGHAVFMFHTCLSEDKLLPVSCSQIFREKQPQGLGFSLILYAWKND